MTVDPQNPGNSFPTRAGTPNARPYQRGVRPGAAGVSLPTATFSPVQAALPAGRLPADISHTWDGVLHAIDSDGAPYVYDREGQAWGRVGTGVDAAALVGGTIYHFRGGEYVTSQFGANEASAPVAMAEKPEAGAPPSSRYFLVSRRARQNPDHSTTMTAAIGGPGAPESADPVPDPGQVVLDRLASVFGRVPHQCVVDLIVRRGSGQPQPLPSSGIRLLAGWRSQGSGRPEPDVERPGSLLGTID